MDLNKTFKRWTATSLIRRTQYSFKGLGSRVLTLVPGESDVLHGYQEWKCSDTYAAKTYPYRFKRKKLYIFFIAS